MAIDVQFDALTEDPIINWMVRQFGCGSASPFPKAPCLTAPVHGVMQVTAQVVSYLKLMQRYRMQDAVHEMLVFEL